MRRIFCAAILTTAVLRIATAPVRLNAETVNLAFGIEEFNPHQHQPNPPGFPALVLLGKNVSMFFPRVEHALLFLSVLFGSCCLVVLYRLGAVLFSEWTGRTAALLLLVNPVFWFASLQSPVWPALALLMLLSVWFANRAWSRDTKGMLLGAMVLAIGFGVLPELWLYALPIWFVSARWTRSWKRIGLGGLIMLAGAMVAIHMVWVASGRREYFTELIATWPFGTDVPSLTLAARDFSGWARSLSRFVIWGSTAVVPWIWALPAVASFKAVRFSKCDLAVLGLWILPAAAIHIVGGMSGPGPMVVYVSALCLIGARLLEGLETNIRETASTIAVAAGAILFAGFVTLPRPSDTTPALAERARNIVVYSLWEISIDGLRWTDQLIDSSLWEVGSAVKTGRPIILVSFPAATETERALPWRIASFYLRDRDIWALGPPDRNPEARRVNGREIREYIRGTDITVPIPANARVIWLVDRNGAITTEIEKILPVQRAPRHVIYSDLPSGFGPFTLGGYRFVPDGRS